MRWPHGIFEHDGSLFVADAGTSRIMVWKDAPRACGQQCDFVLGQRTFFELDHKGGCSYPSAKTLNMPYGICVSESSLIVADTASSRLVGFELSELSMGVAARSLAGQIRFDEAGENRWQFPSRNSLCWPYGVASSGDIVAIADSGNNRVLLWRRSAP
jgi:hypothetical protein